MKRFYIPYIFILSIGLLACIADGTGNPDAERNQNTNATNTDFPPSPYGTVFALQYQWENTFWEQFECVCYFDYYEFSTPQDCANWYMIPQDEINEMVQCIDRSSHQYQLATPRAYSDSFQCLIDAYNEIEACGNYLEGNVCTEDTESAFSNCEEAGFDKVTTCREMVENDPAAQSWFSGLEDQFEANDCFAYFDE